MTKLHQPQLTTEKKQINTKKSKEKTKLRRTLSTGSRWLHIYLSMISFAVLLFFAVTGLTLNHPDWFANQQSILQLEGQLKADWVNSPDTVKVAKLEVVEHLRSKHSIKGAVSDFRISDSEVSISFKGPGYSADTYINREDGSYSGSEIKSGFVAVMNDLHKGRDSGKGWAWLIDISAILMTVVSLTGLVLILFLKKKRSSGLLIALIGALACYLIYYLLVP